MEQKKDFSQNLEQAMHHKQNFSLSAPPNKEEVIKAKQKEKQRNLELEQEADKDLKNEQKKQEYAQNEFKITQEYMHRVGFKAEMRWIFLTLFYSGMFPKAPGTMGSLIAILLGLPILYYFAASNLFLAAALIGVIAVKIIDGYEKEGGIHDNKCIVIDELVGVWIAMAMIGFGIYQSILAFILFRLFDIWKPSIIGRIDKKVKGGLGVVGDDALAGFFAGLLGAILFGALEQAGIDIPVLFDFNAQ